MPNTSMPSNIDHMQQVSVAYGAMQGAMEAFSLPSSRIFSSLVSVSGLSPEELLFAGGAFRGHPNKLACELAWDAVVSPELPQVGRQHVLDADLPSGYRLYALKSSVLLGLLSQEQAAVAGLNGFPSAYTTTANVLYSLVVNSRNFATGPNPGLATLGRIQDIITQLAHRSCVEILHRKEADLVSEAHHEVILTRLFRWAMAQGATTEIRSLPVALPEGHHYLLIDRPGSMQSNALVEEDSIGFEQDHLLR